MSQRLAEIYGAVLPKMKEDGIEDTTANRLAALEALRDQWTEEEVYSPTTAWYLLAVHIEIARLNVVIAQNIRI